MRDDCTEKCFTASLFLLVAGGKADDVYTEKNRKYPLCLMGKAGHQMGKLV